MSASYQTFPSTINPPAASHSSSADLSTEEAHLLPRRQSPNANALLTTMPGIFWTIGSLYGAASVAFGAFGAHGLKKHIADPQRIASWNTAAHYQVRALRSPNDQ